MSATDLAALVCYAIYILSTFALGAIYLTRSRFMPYHEEAVGKPWQQLDPRLQALLLGFMRAVGGASLAAGIALTILLLIPFRAGEPWSQYAIPGIGLVLTLPSLYATMLVRSRTQAHTPVALMAGGVGWLVLGFILSLF